MKGDYSNMTDIVCEKSKPEMLDHYRRTLRKLNWIARLSNETYPGGLPTDETGLRTLLNRIVMEVREACRNIEKAKETNMPDSAQKTENPGLIFPHGSYQELTSFQMAEIVYDATIVFCDRFISKRSRTHDQMVQAARSGKQNIAEGCMASGTSKKTEIKLVGVARASLEELLVDYKDYLRQNGLDLWNKDQAKTKTVRALAFAENRSYKTYKSYFEEGPAETAANTAMCLVHQTNYLLDQQLRTLEKEFLEKGGFTERLYKTRMQRKNKGSS